jgi:predicted dehydrogenase
MLDKMGKEIDAVCINTPDHTHFAATLESMQRGKHVITQKPLTHDIWQARTLRRAAQKYKVVTNMGNQGHT